MTINEFLKTGGKIIPHTVYEISDKDGIDLTTDFWSGQTHWLDEDEMKKFIANRELPHMPIAVWLQGTGEPQWITLPRTNGIENYICQKCGISNSDDAKVIKLDAPFELDTSKMTFNDINILAWHLVFKGIHNMDELAKYVNLPNSTEDDNLIEAFCNKAGCSSLLKKAG